MRYLISRRGLELYTLLSIRYLSVVGEGQNNTHYCLLDISEQQERARTIHITVYQISQSSRRGLEQYTLLPIRYLRVVGEGQNNTHYCLLDISEQQERARTIHITVYQISQSSRRGLEQYTLLSIRYLRVVGEGQNNTHYCLLVIISQISRRALELYTLLSIRYLRVVGEGQNNTHQQERDQNCLLDISEQYTLLQQERARTIHITVYQISQSSRRGLEQYTLLSIRYLRVVGEGQNNTHYCVYQISQISRRGLEQYTLLSIRYLRLVGEGQNNTHYCLLDISEQQERARTIHITVYQISIVERATIHITVYQISQQQERARTHTHQERAEQYQISQSSRRGLEQYTLLSIRYLRVVGEGQNNTHYCLLDISEQQERARTIHITVYQISQSSRRGLEQYTLLSIRYLRVVGEGQNNTHYCLLDISEQQERARNNTHYCLLDISEQQEKARTIHIIVYQISQSSRRALELYTLLSIRYLRVVGEGQNNTHYCLLDISEQQERARTIHITVYQISQSSRRGLEQYTLLSIRYLRVVGEGQNNTHYCLLDISEQQERARTIHIIVYQISQISRRGLEHYTLLSIRYLRVVGEGQNNHITVYQISQSSRRGLEQYTLLSIRYLRVVGEGQNNTHTHTVYQISQCSRRGLEQYTLLSIRYLRLVGEGQNFTHYCLLDISAQ